MKQETLEEAGVVYAKTVNQNHTSHMLGFHNGAKWQQERSYSEEDMKNAFIDGWQLRDGDLPFTKAKNKWFKEFKKEII